MAQPALAGTVITVTGCDESHLDAAIAQANSDNAGDTVTFGCSGTIGLTSTLDITGSMTLDGSGQQVALDGQGQVGVLSVASGITFTLNDLTIQNGSAGSGGGLWNDGGTVSVTNSTFTGNTATEGGAVANVDGGTLTISADTFTGNKADHDTGGEDYGGAVFNENLEPTSGALIKSTVDITGSSFDGNIADVAGSGITRGGAIFNGGTMSIKSTVFYNGNLALYGGAIYYDGIGWCSSAAPCALDVANSYFTQNQTYGQGGEGGAIDVFGGTADISFATFAFNLSQNGGNLEVSAGHANVQGSILAEGGASNCGGTAPTDQGYNAETSTDCGFISTGDLQNANPGLNSDGSLAHGSPAIDAVPLSLCPGTDLTGSPRPDDPSETACDMGAFESDYTAAATTTTLSSSPSPSTVGQPVTFTATVTPTDGGGTVAFDADGSAIGGCGAQPLAQASGSTYTATCTTSALAVGSHTVSASYTGDSGYAGSSGSLPGGQTVNPIPQSISFTAPATGTVGGQATLTATGGGSGNPVVFSVDPSSGAGVCSTSGTNGATVSYTAAGSCVIDANQAGNADYTAAPQVTQTITVDQAPAFVVAAPPLAATTGQPYDYIFTASGTPAPSYALAPGAPSWLSVSASTGEVTGTPPAGTSSFTYSVTATNRAGTATAGPFTVTVTKPSPNADLSAALTCPAAMTVGGTGTCTLQVANAGPAAASKVVAAVALPAALSEVSCTAGCTQHANVMVWKLASLANGASATFNLTIKASCPGSPWMLAAVASQSPDPKPLNNITAQRITIKN